ncbi:hypothetical protein DSO57_1033946 [Entomophthora muscae]|uniref:Uncharacterized protein n=1 Tax=Entomophthora muscae TaxID=34485 RepID=A0ACC2SP30_9FUNG|nr:hypothetical protein DSO57_1033946 [Entomophthora muscae]
MTVYPIVTALTGFQFTNLLPYILQVVPTVTGFLLDLIEFKPAFIFTLPKLPKTVVKASKCILPSPI